MTARAFITGESKSRKIGGIATALGAVLYGGIRLAKGARFANNPEVMGVGLASPVVWVAKKVGGKKAADLVTKVVSAPNEVMNKPLEAFAKTGEGSVASNLVDTKFAQKFIGDNAEERLEGLALKTSSLGGKISNGLGNALKVIDKQFNFSGKLDKKIDAKRKDLGKEMRQAFKNVKNSQSRWDKIKASFGMKVDKMASPEDIAKFYEENEAREHISSAANKQYLHNKMPTLERQNLRKKADAVYAKKTEEREKFFSDGLKGIKGRKNKNKKRQELAEEFKLTFSEDEQKIIKDADAADARRDYIGETTSGIKAKLQDSVGNKKLSKSATRVIDKYENAHNDLHKLKNKKALWENPADEIKRRAKNVTLSDVADFTVRYGAIAQDAVHSVKATKIEIRTLKMLIGDLTGKNPKNISTLKALFGGGASPMVKAARKQFYRSFISTYLTFGIGAGLQQVISNKLKRKLGKDSMWATIASTAGFMALQKVGDALGGGNRMLQTFADMRIAQEEGAVLNAQDYAHLLENSSEDIRKIGGVSNYNTVLIAQYYTANQTDIADVMKDIAKGKTHLMELSKKGAEAMEQYSQAQQEALDEPSAVTDNSLVQEGKFTSQERNKPKGGVGGSFTDKVVTAKTAVAPFSLGS